MEWPAPKFRAWMATVAEYPDPVMTAVARVGAAQLSVKMAPEDFRQRGPLQPEEVVPEILTPSLAKWKFRPKKPTAVGIEFE